jgi:hypothetical protein
MIVPPKKAKRLVHHSVGEEGISVSCATCHRVRRKRTATAIRAVICITTAAVAPGPQVRLKFDHQVTILGHFV